MDRNRLRLRDREPRRRGGPQRRGIPAPWHLPAPPSRSARRPPPPDRGPDRDRRLRSISRVIRPLATNAKSGPRTVSGSRRRRKPVSAAKVQPSSSLSTKFVTRSPEPHRDLPMLVRPEVGLSAPTLPRQARNDRPRPSREAHRPLPVPFVSWSCASVGVSRYLDDDSPDGTPRRQRGRAGRTRSQGISAPRSGAAFAGYQELSAGARPPRGSVAATRGRTRCHPSRTAPQALGPRRRARGDARPRVLPRRTPPPRPGTRSQSPERTAARSRSRGALEIVIHRPVRQTAPASQERRRPADSREERSPALCRRHRQHG